MSSAENVLVSGAGEQDISGGTKENGKAAETEVESGASSSELATAVPLLNDLSAFNMIGARLWSVQIARGIRQTPFKGIATFYDIAPIFRDPSKFMATIELWTLLLNKKAFDVVAVLDGRGLPFGPILASILNLPCEMLRKKGKLPLSVEGPSYVKEYEEDHGADVLCCQTDLLGCPNPLRVLLIDDIIATGGTIQAATALLENLGHKVVCATCIATIPGLEKNRQKLVKAPIVCLLETQTIGDEADRLEPAGPLK